MSEKGPCYNCDKRHSLCHSSCEDYLRFRKWLDERNEQRRRNKEKEQCYYSRRKYR